MAVGAVVAIADGFGTAVGGTVRAKGRREEGRKGELERKIKA
jgi:hypothetical protein